MATEDNTPEKEKEKSSFVDWENPPKLTDLKDNLTEALSSHNAQVSKVDNWLDYMAGTGKAKKQTPTGRSSIVPRLIRKQAEWRYAALTEPFLSTVDLFNTAPKTWEDTSASKQNGLLLNHQFNAYLDKAQFIDESIRTAVDEGTLIYRVGWRFEEEEIEEEVPVFDFIATNDPATAQEHQQLHQLMTASPEEYAALPEELIEAHELTMKDGVPIRVQQNGTETITRTVTSKNHPTVDVSDYNNIIVDPTAQGNIDKANFIIYSFETSTAELKKSGLYKNIGKINLTSNVPVMETNHNTKDDSHFSFTDEPRKRIVAYEYWGYWDIDDTGLVEPFVATWVGDTLIRLEKSPYPFRELPFVSVQYLPVRKSIYGEPDAELLMDNQDVLGAVTRGVVDIMGRSANGQVGYSKEALDIVNKRRFDRGEDYEYNPNIDPSTAFYAHKFPEVPASAQYMINLQNLEADNMTGIRAFGNTNPGSTLDASATAYRGALDAASKRESGILKRLAEGLVKVARKISAMNAEFLEEDEVVRVTNEEFVPISREDLEGNFDISITISTAEADNAKAQELAFMLQTTGQSADPGEIRMIRAEIARLRKMPDLAKRIEEYEPQPDPLVQQKAQLEVALLEAQVRNENAKAAENTVDIGLKKAKTQTEIAKGKNLDSNTDMVDLDFLEKESGTVHERELDKQDKDRLGKLDIAAATSQLKGPESKG